MLTNINKSLRILTITTKATINYQLCYLTVVKLSPSSSSSGAELALFPAYPPAHPNQPWKVFSELQLTKQVYWSKVVSLSTSLLHKSKLVASPRWFEFGTAQPRLFLYSIMWLDELPDFCVSFPHEIIVILKRE